MTSSVTVETCEDAMASGEAVNRPVPPTSNQDSAGPVWHEAGEVRFTQPQIVGAPNQTTHCTQSRERKEEWGVPERTLPDSVTTMVHSLDGSDEALVALAEIILGQVRRNGTGRDCDAGHAEE